MSIPAQKSPAQAISYWLKRLDRPLLPVRAEVRDAALAKLNAPTGNAQNVAAILSRDPALVTLLLCACNRVISNPGRAVVTPQHAIALLGIYRVSKLLREAPLLNKQEHPQWREYLHAQSVSLHAGAQLRSWQQQIPHWEESVPYWLAVMFDAPRWALWIADGTAMMTLWERCASLPGASRALERQLLGIGIDLLSARLCRSWGIPQQVSDAHHVLDSRNARTWVTISRTLDAPNRNELLDDPDIQELLRKPPFLLRLCNELAHSVDWSWQQRRSERLLDISAAATGLSRDRIVALSHQAAAAVSPELEELSLLPPAAALLMQFDRHRLLRFGLPEQHRHSRWAPRVLHRPAIDPEQLKRQLHRIHHAPASNLSELCDQLADALAALHLPFSAVMLRTRDANGVRAVATRGHDQHLQQQRLPLQERDLFSQLLVKPGALRMDGQNRERIVARLPERLRHHRQPEYCFCASLFAGDRPVGLVYADSNTHEPPLTEAQYRAFRQLCQTFNRRLAMPRTG